MPDAPRNRHHVFLASNLWTDLWITQQPISDQIGRREQILFVERPVSVFTVLRYPRLWRRLFTWMLGARRQGTGLSLLAPLPLFHLGHRFPRIFAAEFSLQRRWILRWAKHLGSGERVLWIDNPLYHRAFGRMGEALGIYYASDEFSAFRQSHRPTAEALEEAAVRRADLVFAAATTLAEGKRRINPHTYAIWNGIDADVFRAPEPRAVAAEVEAVPPPRVAFVGVLAEWVDVELLRAVASLLPGVQFIIVGPSQVEHLDLRRLPNVHWFGRRGRGEVPAILRRCSASLVPFRRGVLTQNTLPLKIFESLAAGAVPICTRFSGDLDRLATENLVVIADGAAGFATAVKRAVESDSAEQRERFAAFGARQTWEERWRQMDAIISETEALRSRGAGPKHEGKQAT